MTTKTGTKINTLEALLHEKARLHGLCRYSEQKLTEHMDYVSRNYVKLTVDQFFIPAIRHTFNKKNLLRLFHLESIAEAFSAKDGKPGLSDLGGLFGKSGWALALSVGMALLKRYMKK